MISGRRNFLRGMACAGIAGTLGHTGCRSFESHQARSARSMIGFKTPPMERLRIGVIGIGHRGRAAVARLSTIERTFLTALADLKPERVAQAAQTLTQRALPTPQVHHGAPYAWKRLCEAPDVDLVYICTPWVWHTPMALYAMQCGKHVAVEVPAALTLEQCWQLVDTAEKTRRHCMLLENCCYGENELLALMLCRKGVLGELVHGEAAYIHDLRAGKFAAAQREERWRLMWSEQHTGNPYPTHGLGPICQYMDINRGDRMEYLTSVSSAQRGLSLMATKKFGKSSAEARAPYKLGDVNTTIIKTFRGRTIMVQHDTTTPRPYSRLNLIAGTKGVLADYPLRVALEPRAQLWLPPDELTALRERYRHPLWQQSGTLAQKMGGHGGMDALMDLRLCHCLLQGLPLDIDVYDSALWSSLVDLTERSVKRRGATIEIPDFTRGAWKWAPPLGIVTL